MKKVIALISLLYFSVFANAQVQKGAIAIGGSLGLTFSNTNTSSIRSQSNTYPNQTQLPDRKTTGTNWQFNPNVSYFLSDKFALGVYLGIAYGNGKTQESYLENGQYKTANLKNNTSGINGGVFGKYYISLSEKAYFILGANAGYNSTKYDSQRLNSYYLPYGVYEGYKVKSSFVNLAIVPSFIFFPTDKLGIEFSLGSFLGLRSGKSENTDNYMSGGNGVSFIETQKRNETSTELSILSVNTLNPTIGLYYFIK